MSRSHYFPMIIEGEAKAIVDKREHGFYIFEDCVLILPNGEKVQVKEIRVNIDVEIPEEEKEPREMYNASLEKARETNDKWREAHEKGELWDSDD